MMALKRPRSANFPVDEDELAPKKLKPSEKIVQKTDQFSVSQRCEKSLEALLFQVHGEA